MDTLNITSGPVLIRPTDRSLSVVWVTDRPCVSKVEYGTHSGLNQTAVPSHHGLVDALTRVHNVTLDGLSPGRTYYYRVVSEEILDFLDRNVIYGDVVKSPVHHFTTLDPDRDNSVFVLINDMHGDRQLLEGMLEQVDWNGVDFVVFNGDMVDHFEEPTDISTHILNPAAKYFAKHIPLVFVRGNHESRGPYARDLPDYVLDGQQKFYYTFEQGPARFAVMDSGEDKEDQHIEYSGLAHFGPYRRQQTEWLKEEVQSARSPSGRVEVVFSHMPLFGGNNWHGERQIRGMWAPLFDKKGVRVVISGHTHELAHLPPDQTGVGFHLLINGRKMTARVIIKRDQIQFVFKDINGKFEETILMHKG